MTTKKQEIVKIDPKEFGLEETKATEIQAAFQPMLQKMVDLEDEFNEVSKLEISPEACEKAKEVRLKYVKVRTGTAAIHKEMKSFYLAGGRFVDGWKNAQLFASEGKEAKLKEIEEHYDLIEKQRIDDLRDKRVKLLEPYGTDTTMVALGHMSDEVWANYFTGVKAAHQIQIDAEKKVEADRIAKEKAEQEERERIAKENEQLRKEAEEKEKDLQAERAKAQKEADERAKIEDELQAKKDAEAQAIKDAEEAKKQSELAPDKEKLSELIDNINAIEMPNLATDKASEIVKGVNNLLDKVVQYINEKSNEL